MKTSGPARLDRGRRQEAAPAPAPAAARLEAANRLLAAIGALQSRFIGDAPMGTILKETLESFLLLTDSQYGFLGEALLTPDQLPYFKIQALSDSAWTDIARDFYSRHAPIGLEFYDLDNLFGQILQSGQPVIVNDMPPAGGALPAGHPPMRAFLGLPIAHGSEVLGMVGLANRPGGYDRELLDFLQPLAATCGSLINAHRANLWRQGAESELRREALVFDNISDAIVLTDREGRVLNCNPAAQAALGRARKKLLGMPLGFLLASGQAPERQVRDALAAVDREGQWQGVLTVRPQDGGRRIWQATVLPLQDAAADDNILVWFNRDETERLAAQAKLEERTQELNTIADLSPDGFVFIDARHRVTYVNPAFEHMTGLAASDLVGMAHPALRAALAGLCDQPDRDDGLVHLARPHFAILKRTVRSLRDDAGRIRGTVEYYRDVTQETEVDRMKSEFLSTAAHELRTPMASVFGFAELLLRRRYPADKEREFLEIIHRQAGQLVTLINELLDLARIEARAGKDFRIVAHALAPILRSTLDQFLVPGDERQVEVRLPARLPRVMVDPSKLQNALGNVLSNAYKYSMGRGPIQLSVRTCRTGQGRQVGIQVRDQGIGMTADQLARIFDRFYRADACGNIQGTGLGMSIVKEIMGIFRGSVDVASRPGEGTSVTLWLPVAPPRTPGKEG